MSEYRISKDLAAIIASYLFLIFVVNIPEAVYGEVISCDSDEFALPENYDAFPSGENKYFDVYQVPSKSEGDVIPVLLLHELPGLNCKAIRLAHQLADQGFNVYLPHLLGNPGEDTPVRNSVRLLFDNRWNAYSSHQDSVIIEQIDELATFIYESTQHKIGIIGMCLTGSFPIAMMSNAGVGAVVVSQPALPLLAFTEKRKASLGISDQRIKSAQDKDDIPILGFRYQLDNRVSPWQKFQSLKSMFPDNFHNCEVSVEEVARENQAHSVLTEQYGQPESVLRVSKTIEFFDMVLRQKSQINAFKCP